jgi:hypothetical protein
MPMVEVYEDILDVKANTRVCTINLTGAMGAGVAKRFRDNVPGVFKHYKKMYTKIEPTQFIAFKTGGELHLLIPTKLDWKNDSPRNLVIQNLHKLADLVLANPELSPVALPPMGCGNGGLNYYSDIRHEYHVAFDNHPGQFIVTLGKDEG